MAGGSEGDGQAGIDRAAFNLRRPLPAGGHLQKWGQQRRHSHHAPLPGRAHGHDQPLGSRVI